MRNEKPISERPAITPEMKVGEFLEYYPELEEALIDIAPVFARLKNPVLRKTIAKVASLNQAALVGDVSIGEMINKLRRTAGDSQVMAFDENGALADREKPRWLDESRIIHSLDARPIIDRGDHPLGTVVKQLNRMEPNEVYELITSFYPAPLIDKVKALGFKAWSQRDGANIVRSYFCKPGRTDN